MEADVERMKTSTVGQAYDMLYRQAATEKLRRETELLGIEEPEEPEQYEVFFDEYGRRMKRDVLTGEEFQVTGLPPAPSLTMEERLKLKKTPTDIARGDYWRNKETGDIQWVDYGAKPPEGYSQRVPSREVQVSDIPGKRFELTKDKAVRDSAVRIRMNLKNPAVMGEIDFINKNSDSTSGFIWMETARTFWPDVKETVEVKLPKDRDGKQLTMADIRKVATDNNVAIEEVLRQIHEL